MIVVTVTVTITTYDVKDIIRVQAMSETNKTLESGRRKYSKSTPTHKTRS